MKDEWRLTNQMKYMHRAKMMKATFVIEKEAWDHEHCEFCWERISEYPDEQHEGYCTLDRYRWVCEECYQDFKDMFEWELVEQPTIAP